MYINSIIKDTDISIITDDGAFNSIFHSVIDHIRFAVNSEEFTNIASKHFDTPMRLNFSQAGKLYEFQAKPLRTFSVPNFEHLIEFQAMSEIKESTKREHIRITNSIKTSVLLNGYSICAGVSSDLSSSGICIWSDIEILEPRDTEVVIKLDLVEEFFIKAKLKRKQQNTSTRAYAFEYGFLFEFDRPEQKERFMSKMLEARIKSLSFS